MHFTSIEVEILKLKGLSRFFNSLTKTLKRREETENGDRMGGLGGWAWQQVKNGRRMENPFDGTRFGRGKLGTCSTLGMCSYGGRG